MGCYLRAECGAFRAKKPALSPTARRKNGIGLCCGAPGLDLLRARTNEGRRRLAEGRKALSVSNCRRGLRLHTPRCFFPAFGRTRLVRAGGRRQASLSRSSFRFAVLRRGVVREDKHRRAASATDIRAPLPPAARRSRSLRLLRASPPAAARPLPPRAVRCV